LILSDIHSNIEALQSVIDLADNLGGFDQIWHLGDVVGYGPDPAACIDLLRGYDHLGVAGNHDLAVLGKIGLDYFNTHAAAAARWTREQLGEDHLEYLGGLPLRLETHDFTAVHASPRSPIEEYVLSVPTAAENFRHFDTKRCLVGHSHFPFLCQQQGESAEFFEFPVGLPVSLEPGRFIINPGSVGQPRDGIPTASFAIYDSSLDSITHLRAEYDIPLTQRKIRDVGLPGYLAARLGEGV
jgi:diadenosine tetraphosphatase ApaH/serine/threonine PP2A family protein phosphatase